MPLTRCNSVDDFVLAQQQALDQGRLLMLEPVELEFTQPVEFKLRGTKFPTGLWAYGSVFKWKTDGGWEHDMLTYRTDGSENQYFTLQGLSINGDQTGGAQASPKRLLTVEGRSGAAVRGFQIDDITFEGGQTGIWIEGEIFEGYVNRARGSWMRNAGIVCRHGYGEVPGVLSNVYLIEPNITRCPQNMGAAMGIFCDRANSVLIDNGNFISLDGPAIRATNGVKRITNCDFENTGNTNGVAIEIDTSDFGTMVLACTGSNTNGAMKNLLRYGGDQSRLQLHHNDMYNGNILE